MAGTKGRLGKTNQPFHIRIGRQILIIDSGHGVLERGLVRDLGHDNSRSFNILAGLFGPNGPKLALVQCRLFSSGAHSGLHLCRERVELGCVHANAFRDDQVFGQ